MSDLDTQRENALLKATLREFLRIADEARNGDRQIGPECAYYGELLEQWLAIERKARKLLKP